jgi:glutamine synthetase
MFSQATKLLARREAKTVAVRTMASVEESFAEYGRNVFTGKVADEYLSKHGANSELLKDPAWVSHSADKVAAAVFDW